MASLLDRTLAHPLRGLSDDPQERRNVLWLTLANLLSGAGAVLFGGELMQGFLTKTEFDSEQIGRLLAISPMANAIGLLIFMGLADRVRRRVRTYALCLLLTGLSPALTALMALAARSALGPGHLWIGLATLFASQGLVSALAVMLDYPIIVRAFRTEIRGRIFGILTTTYSMLAVLLGWLSANVLKHVEYPMGYVWCFLAAACAIALRAAIYSRMRELPELAVDGESDSALPVGAIVQVLKMREFQLLGPPHILRGLCSGLAGLIVVMGLKRLHLPDYYPGYAASSLHAANILGGLALGLVADRWGAGRTTLLADILLAIGLGAVMLSGSPALFLVLYFVVQFGIAVEGSSVPLGCINIVPPEHLGAFSAARLMVLNGFASVGTALFGYLFKYYDPTAVFAIGAALKLVNGIWFWYVFRPAHHRGVATVGQAAEPDVEE